MADEEERKSTIPKLPLEPKKLWKNSKPRLNNLLDHLKAEGRLAMDDAVSIVRKAGALFKKESNLLKLQDPITICGDVHGQFYDLLRLLEAGGDPANTQYLFLGDYVDRGCFSCEVVFYLFSLKIHYPKKFFMLRGNHECRHLTAFFNFQDECNYKYNEHLYDEIMNAFDNLPLAATVNKKFLCIHGGLSPDIKFLRDIEDINRFREVPREGPFCDLLWADPVPERGDENNSDDDSDSEIDEDLLNTTWFAYNSTRQCSHVFGVDAVQTFLKKNKLSGIIRAHEAQSQGYKMAMKHPKTEIPRVITIFSAPNYCDVYGNKAACLRLDGTVLNIRQFIASPHPYYLPNFMDVFSWSLPFVAEKVTDMLASVVNWSQDEDSDDDVDMGGDAFNDERHRFGDGRSWSLRDVLEDRDPAQQQHQQQQQYPEEEYSDNQRYDSHSHPPAADRRHMFQAASSKRLLRLSDFSASDTDDEPRQGGPVLKEKVKAITKMLRMYKLLRTQNDLVVELKQLTPNRKLPPGVLQGGKKSLQHAISSFREARRADAPNERMPSEAQRPRNLHKNVIL